MGDTPTSTGLRPLWQLTLARFREFYREPAAIFWVYGFPLILAVVLGAAFRDRPVEQIRVDVRADGPGRSAAAEGVRRVLTEHDPRLLVTLSGEQSAAERLRTAKTDLVYLPPADRAGLGEYLFDRNRPESTLARAAVDNVLLRVRSPDLPKATETAVTDPGSRYIDFLIPGLLGMNLMGGGLFGVGFLIVDLRVRKLLKRFLATPMRKTDFLLSMMLSRLAFTLVEIALLSVFAYLVYDIRVRGDFTAFVGTVVIGATAFAGLGLLIACRAKTLETVSGLMNAIMMPMWLLSGVFFSYERYPDWMHPFIQALPLTAVNDALRAVVNDGGGWGTIAPQLGVLAAWGGLSFVLALRLFRWR